MNREEINELFNVTDEQLDHMGAPYESGEWEGGVGAVVHGCPGSSESEADLFYSEANMRHLRHSIDQLNHGEASVHEVVED